MRPQCITIPWIDLFPSDRLRPTPAFMPMPLAEVRTRLGNCSPV